MHRWNSGTSSYDLVAQPPPIWPLINISASRTLTKEKTVIATGAITLTLPATHQLGDEFGIVNAGTDNVTLARNGNNIDGAAQDFILAPDDRCKVESDGTDWWSTTVL